MWGVRDVGVSGMWVSGMWDGGVRDAGAGVRDVGSSVRDGGGGVRDAGGGGGDSCRLAASSETQLCDLLQQVFAVLHVVHWRGADAHSLQTALLLKRQQQWRSLRMHSLQTSEKTATKTGGYGERSRQMPHFLQKQQQKLGLRRTPSQCAQYGTKLLTFSTITHQRNENYDAAV